MPEETVAEVMQVYAADAIASVREVLALDYSMESLRAVEQFLEIGRAGFEGEDGRLRSLAMMWGAYVGEVLRRRWGGEWCFREEGPFQRKLCLVIRDPGSDPPTREITLFPPERVYKQLINGSNDGIWSYGCAIEGRLSKRPK
jgi:hypothetical protein